MKKFPPVEQLTPGLFEKMVRDWLSSLSGELKKFEAVHQADLKGAEGSYKIDVAVRFRIFGGSEIKVLVECKKQRSPIKREVVQILHSKLSSLGAHKGIVFSTSNFQRGAIEFAESHGIALVEIKEGFVRYIRAAVSREFPPIPSDAEDYVGWVYGCEAGALPELISRDGCFKLERYFEKPLLEGE